MNERIITLDVETGWPTSNRIRDYLVREAKPAANLKDPDKIKASLEANQDKAIAQSSLSPLWAEVAVICVNHGEDTIAFHSRENGERRVLGMFNCYLSAQKQANNGRSPTFSGFNIAQFDLKLLWTRMMIHGIKPACNLQHDAKPWSDKVQDLRMILSGGDPRAPGTLQDWVVAFGGMPREDDEIPGAEVPQALADGRLEDVIYHCKQDVAECLWLRNKLGLDS